MFTKYELARYIDHSILPPEISYDEVRRSVQFAKDAKCRTVCVTGQRVKMAYAITKGSETSVGSVAGFPFGCHTTETKVFETIQAFENGAREIDIVLNVGAMKSGDYDTVYNDVKAVVDCSPCLVKVILETCLLTKDEIAKASRICSDAGVGFVKTSTGYSTGGATVEDIKIMKENIDTTRVEIKAAGGLKTLKQCEEFIKAGCTRLGMSRTKSILAEIDERNK